MKFIDLHPIIFGISVRLEFFELHWLGMKTKKNCKLDLMGVNLLALFFFTPFILLSQTSNPVFNWAVKEISKDNNLQVMSVHDENTAVIAGFGKTFKITTDKGISWKDAGLLNPLFNFNDISIKGKIGYMVARKTILVDNANGAEDDVYISGAILKTTDGGNNWSLLDLSKIGDGANPAANPSLSGCFTLTPYSVLCIDETTALVYVQWYELTSGAKKTHSAVFKTVNGGDKWIAVTKDFGASYVTSIKMFGTDIYIGGNKILLKGSTTTDTTTDIFPAFSAVAGSNAYVNEIRSFKSNEIGIITSASGFLTTTDGGNTFTKLSGISGGFDFFKDDKVMIFMGASSGSKATIDGGTTWTSCSPGKTCVEIPGIFNDSLYALTNSSLAYKMALSDLKSGNYKWVEKKIADGTSSLQKMYQFDNNSAIIIGDDQIVKKTLDKGKTWQPVILPELYVNDGQYDFRSVSSSGGAGYATTRLLKLGDYSGGENYYLSGLIFKTEDAWKTWKVLNNKNIGKDTPKDASKYPLMEGCYGMDNYTVECIDAKTAYLNVDWNDSVSVPKTITRHSRVFKTIDGGDSWSAVTKDFGISIITSIKFMGEIGYISGNKIFMKTVDGGKTFTDLLLNLAPGADNDLNISSIVMRTKDELYFQTSNNKGVFYTRDGGATFSKLPGVFGGFDFVVLDNNSFMSVGPSTNNKFTNDGGLNWKNCNLTTEIYAAGKVFNDSLYVLGKSNVYKIAVSDLDIATLVSDIKSPNSFKILYGPSGLQLVSEEGDIDRCFIYNVAGQLMAIADPKSSSYSIDYNSFNPGVYIISALIDGKKYTQKVIFK